MPITFEARRSFVRQATCLSVWLARRLAEGMAEKVAGRGMRFREALTHCTNVYRFTTLWDGKHHPADMPGWRDARWEGLLDEMDRIDGRFAAGDATAEMEAAGLELLWPWMEGRVERDVAEWPVVAERPFGFFNYKPGDERWEEGQVTLHLRNPFSPASPFEDLRARAEELSRLLLHARQQRPQQNRVSLQSWLAAVPPLQSLFPPEFAASASKPSRLEYHLGWWGQFIDRAGDFHQRNGQHLRTTGQFRYPCITCACSIDATLAHLRERFGTS